MAAKKTAKKGATKAAAKKPAKKAKKATKKAAKKPAKAKKATKKPAKKKKAASKSKSKTTTKKKASSSGTTKAPKTGASAAAAAILDADDTAARVAEHAALLLDARSSTATKAARVIHEFVEGQPELLQGHVDKFAQGITSKHKRVIQVSADALPAIAKIAPARVAKHLDTLKAAFEPTIDDGKDGLVRTFANLCTASVAYQKRLEPVLTLALEGANGKTLLRWSQIVLPALKGEPHARARAVVEGRLDRIPRAVAQQIAQNLGIRLRVRYR